MVFLATKIGNHVLGYVDGTADELQRNEFAFGVDPLGGME
jgi:hypothetical protein